MHPVVVYLLVGAGSALGGMLRHALASLVFTYEHGKFPWGILTVNLIGCLLMGLAFALLPREDWKLFLMSGILGGFTTFSAFSLITLELHLHHRWDLALLYVAVSVIGCIACVAIGYWSGTTLRGPIT